MQDRTCSVLQRLLFMWHLTKRMKRPRLCAGQLWRKTREMYWNVYSSEQRMQPWSEHELAISELTCPAWETQFSIKTSQKTHLERDFKWEWDSLSFKAAPLPWKVTLQANLFVATKSDTPTPPDIAPVTKTLFISIYIYILFFFSLSFSISLWLFLSFFLSFCKFCCVWLFFRLHPLSVILCFCDFLFVWLSVCVAFILFHSFLSALFFLLSVPFSFFNFLFPWFCVSVTCFVWLFVLWQFLCLFSLCDFLFLFFFSARFSVTYSLSSLFFLLVVLSKVALLKSLWLWSFSTILFS